MSLQDQQRSDSTSRSASRLSATADVRPRLAGQATEEESPELLRWRADILLDEMMLGGLDLAGAAQGESATGGMRGADEPPIAIDRRWPPPAASTAEPSDPWAPRRGWSDADTPLATPVRGEPPGYQTPLRDTTVADPSDPSRSLLRPPSAVGAEAEEAASLFSSGRARWGERPQSPHLNRRGQLLPRLSQPDVRQLQQELSALQESIAALLPAGHDWRERSTHLLDKAASILHNDAERSAEVDYYLQQVRAIQDRARQTYVWSKLYWKRLLTYHLAWLFFSLVTLTACGLYARAMTDWFAPIAGWEADGFAALNLVALLATLCAATLGAALGALRTMSRFHRLEQGFFDRKFGLRGLLLPVFALFVATVVCAIFGLIYWLAGVNPLANPLAMGPPAIVAFIFGFIQESIYGTAV